MIQCDLILSAMLVNDYSKIWTAKDFQKGDYFVGYEASARMSELAKKYPTMFIVGKQDRFRTLQINEKDIGNIIYHKKRLGLL